MFNILIFQTPGGIKAALNRLEGAAHGSHDTTRV